MYINIFRAYINLFYSTNIFPTPSLVTADLIMQSQAHIPVHTRIRRKYAHVYTS